MATKIESYQTTDGKFFPDEISAVRHEVLTDLLAKVPALKDRWTVIESNVETISRALQPLAAILPENHPEAPAENHPEPPVAVDHGELAGLCDCSAGMNGADDHAISCPAHRENVRARDLLRG